jgi:hypothetical protein
MAKASLQLVRALRDTAVRLEAGAAYQWGHHGQCNCGHLVQTLCRLEPRVIHAWALEAAGGVGEWELLANDFCPTSGQRIDDVIAALLDAGLTTDDLVHLERLDDVQVLAQLPAGARWLARNVRDDAIAYLRAWATLLEGELPVLEVAPARAA